MEEAARAFLLGFPALFSIVNPISGAFIFREVTAGRTAEERRERVVPVELGPIRLQREDHVGHVHTLHMLAQRMIELGEEGVYSLIRGCYLHWGTERICPYDADNHCCVWTGSHCPIYGLL